MPISYNKALSGLTVLLENARRLSTRAVNAIMTATYWEIGRRIVELEQHGQKRADYGEEILVRLAHDLSLKFGRGFSERNLYNFRQFFLSYPISQTLSAKSIKANEKGTAVNSVEIHINKLQGQFKLPWSHYVLLLSVRNENARKFYETEALRGGWSVRQLDRQISSQFYERTALSKNKAAMLTKGSKAKPEDFVSPDEEIKDPFVLEFLDLKDEYSESELEAALIKHMESFLLELGSNFTFVARQRRLRIGDEWYRIDLLFFHRKLRCLVIIDLKLGRFTHADSGQMHLYLNYAREHWMNEGENPPVGLILCARKNAALAHYALEGLPTKILAREYLTTLPKEKILVTEIEKTRNQLEGI